MAGGLPPRPVFRIDLLSYRTGGRVHRLCEHRGQLVGHRRDEQMPGCRQARPVAQLGQGIRDILAPAGELYLGPLLVGGGSGAALPQPESGHAGERVASLQQGGPRPRVISPRRVAQVVLRVDA